MPSEQSPFGSIIPTEVWCHFLGGFLSSMAHFLSAYIMQITCQLSATRIFEPKMGFNPEVYHWIILPSSVPLLGEDNLPFLPLLGVSYSSGTESHPLPNNVSLCFLPGRHWWRNQGKLLHNSRQQAFCFMLMLAYEEREFGCRALDNKWLSSSACTSLSPQIIIDPLLINWTLLTPCLALEKVHCSFCLQTNFSIIRRTCLCCLFYRGNCIAPHLLKVLK